MGIRPKFNKFDQLLGAGVEYARLRPLLRRGTIISASTLSMVERVAREKCSYPFFRVRTRRTV